MTTTVHVSRTFKVDTHRNPEVLEELRLLAARGFEVLGPIDLTPVSPPAKAKPEPLKSRVAEMFNELADVQGLGAYRVGALMGVTAGSVYNWRRGRMKISAGRLSQLERLLKRSRGLPAGSTTLFDEAQGAIAARRRLARPKPEPGLPRGKRGRPVSDETRLEIAVMRKQGFSVNEIKKSLGVGTSTVYLALKALGVGRP